MVEGAVVVIFEGGYAFIGCVLFIAEGAAEVVVHPSDGGGELLFVALVLHLHELVLQYLVLIFKQCNLNIEVLLKIGILFLQHLDLLSVLSASAIERRSALDGLLILAIQSVEVILKQGVHLVFLDEFLLQTLCKLFKLLDGAVHL